MISKPRIYVWIDAAATCNLRCAHCYTLSMQSKGWMREDTWRRVLEALVAGDVVVEKLHLNWRGEPLSNPRLELMVEDMATTGWDVEFHTNGILMTLGRARRFCAVGTNLTIQFSLDGGNAAAFESNRGAGNWTKALAGLEATLDARGSNASPRLGIYQLDLGVDTSDYDQHFLELVDRVDEYKVVSPIKPNGSSTTLSLLTVPRGPCFWIGHTLAIDHEGTAHTCILENNTKIGSLLNCSPSSIIHSARELRRRVAEEGRCSISGCSNCSMREGNAYLPADVYL